MKKLITLLTAALFLTTACTQQKGFKIEGFISGSADGKTVYLCTGSQFYMLTPIDSAVIEYGKFTFTGQLETPERFVLKIFPDDNRGMGERGWIFRPIIPVFMYNENVVIRAELDSIPLDNFDGSYDYSKVQITGSKLHNLYVAYVDLRTELTKARTEAQRGAWARYGETRPVSIGVEIVRKAEMVKTEGKATIQRFIEQNKDNDVGLYAFYDNLDRFTLSELHSIFASFTPKMQKSAYGQRIWTEAERVGQSAEGAMFTDFTLEDKEGNSVQLSDYVGKGQYVMLKFWASWCGPCRADVPREKEVYSIYNPHGFNVVAISLDTQKDAWFKAMGEDQTPWINTYYPSAFEGEIHKVYNFNGIPTQIMIGPDGTILNRDARGPYLDNLLIELFGNKFGDKY